MMKKLDWVEAIKAFKTAIDSKAMQEDFDNWGPLYSNKAVCHLNLKSDAELEPA